jgi:hypothetical protein
VTKIPKSQLPSSQPATCFPIIQQMPDCFQRHGLGHKNVHAALKSLNLIPVVIDNLNIWVRASMIGGDSEPLSFTGLPSSWRDCRRTASFFLRHLTIRRSLCLFKIVRINSSLDSALHVGSPHWGLCVLNFWLLRLACSNGPGSVANISCDAFFRPSRFNCLSICSWSPL